ncbi:MAG: response regulator transcription factor [Clostridiales bacterium]|nr:response regulator transcription factor [Clostridiales bacterium]
MMRVFVVEDEAAIRDLIQIQLELVGYEVDTCSSGLEVKEMLLKRKPDLILLDIMLPGMDGYQLMEQIQSLDIPVIYVTAKDSVVDRVKGLRLGADDYIGKPFDMMELIARIEAVLRRNQKRDTLVRIGDNEINLLQRTVKRKGQEVYLTVKEYELLILFWQNRNIALSREQILERVWGYDFEGLTRTVDIHVQRLREKLGLKQYLKTVFKVGYRLEC